MIDFTKETPLSLVAAAKRFGVAPKTVRRWVRGIGGRQLETAKLGGKLFTSLEAIQRFSLQATKQKRLLFEPGEEALPLFAEKSNARPRKSPGKKR